jgi:hypothetical protein
VSITLGASCLGATTRSSVERRSREAHRPAPARAAPSSKLEKHSRERVAAASPRCESWTSAGAEVIRTGGSRSGGTQQLWASMHALLHGPCCMGRARPRQPRQQPAVNMRAARPKCTAASQGTASPLPLLDCEWGRQHWQHGVRGECVPPVHQWRTSVVNQSTHCKRCVWFGFSY